MVNCNCIEQTNEGLKERGLELDWSFQFGTNWTFIPIRTLGKTKGGKDKPGPIMPPKFCPLCGQAVGSEKAKLDFRCLIPAFHGDDWGECSQDVPAFSSKDAALHMAQIYNEDNNELTEGGWFEVHVTDDKGNLTVWIVTGDAVPVYKARIKEGE